MRQIEDRFNHQFHYPWVFLNDEPFTQEFRLLTAGMASGDVEYGLIEKNEWQTPEWIDTEKAQEAMEKMVKKTYVSIQFGLLFPSPTVDEVCLVLARGTRHRFLLFN